MGIAYRPDDDLAFLQYCSEEDIRQLAQFIIHDKDGKERIASQIKSDPAFKSRNGQPDQWRKSWQLVAGELQHFGGTVSLICSDVKAFYTGKCWEMFAENFRSNSIRRAALTTSRTFS